MNSVERVTSALNHQPPDRPPVAPVLLLQGARLLGLELPEFFSRAEHMARGQEALVEKYDPDVVFGIPNVTEDIQPFGGELAYFTIGSPTVGKMAWRSWNDLDQARVPDPTGHPALVRTLDAIEMLARKFKGEKMIVGGATAPFSLPSLLIGAEKWYELIWEDELIRGPILRRVLELTTGFCTAWCNAQLQAGADAVVIADGMASATSIGREQFEQLALPNIVETIEGIDGPVIYEPVGRIQPFLDLMPATGAKMVILDCFDDMGQCREIVKDRLALFGNLNNIEMIRWDREHTLEQCYRILDQGARDGGLVLSSQGPEIPWDVPDEVIQAIVDAPKTWNAR